MRLLERRALQAALEKLPKAQPRRLVMDEFALFKGHRYASVVLDADTRRVLWIGEGRSRAAVRPFFEELGPEGCARIEAVAMDMNTAFHLEVRQHCPQARVVYDLFHVVADREGQSADASEGRTSLPCDQAPIRLCENPFPWLGQEHGATDHAVCPVESVDGAPAITACCGRGAPVRAESQGYALVIQ